MVNNIVKYFGHLTFLALVMVHHAVGSLTEATFSAQSEIGQQQKRFDLNKFEIEFEAI